MSILSEPYFPDEEAASCSPEGVVWENGYVSTFKRGIAGNRLTYRRTDEARA